MYTKRIKPVQAHCLEAHHIEDLMEQNIYHEFEQIEIYLTDTMQTIEALLHLTQVAEDAWLINSDPQCQKQLIDQGEPEQQVYPDPSLIKCHFPLWAVRSRCYGWYDRQTGDDQECCYSEEKAKSWKEQCA